MRPQRSLLIPSQTEPVPKNHIQSRSLLQSRNRLREGEPQAEPGLEPRPPPLSLAGSGSGKPKAQGAPRLTVGCYHSAAVEAPASGLPCEERDYVRQLQTHVRRLGSPTRQERLPWSYLLVQPGPEPEAAWVYSGSASAGMQRERHAWVPDLSPGTAGARTSVPLCHLVSDLPPFLTEAQVWHLPALQT